MDEKPKEKSSVMVLSNYFGKKAGETIGGLPEEFKKLSNKEKDKMAAG